MGVVGVGQLGGEDGPVEGFGRGGGFGGEWVEGVGGEEEEAGGGEAGE